MRHGTVLVFLFAISTAVSGSTRQRKAPHNLASRCLPQRGRIGRYNGGSSPELLGLEDGTAVQEGLGKTPKGYLMYDSSGHMAVQLSRPPKLAR